MTTIWCGFCAGAGTSGICKKAFDFCCWIPDTQKIGTAQKNFDFHYCEISSKQKRKVGRAFWSRVCQSCVKKNRNLQPSNPKEIPELNGNSVCTNSFSTPCPSVLSSSPIFQVTSTSASSSVTETCTSEGSFQGELQDINDFPPPSPPNSSLEEPLFASGDLYNAGPKPSLEFDFEGPTTFSQVEVVPSSNSHKAQQRNVCVNAILDFNLLIYVKECFNYVFLSADSKNQKPLAVPLFDDSENFYALQSLECLTSGHCNCKYIRKLIYQSYKRSTQADPKNVSLSRLPKNIVSIIELYKIECEALKKQNNKLFLEVQNLKCESGTIEIKNTADNCFLISLLHKALKSNRLPSESFISHLLKQQLNCLNTNDCNGFRWDKDIVHWALTPSWTRFEVAQRRVLDSMGIV
eukprot:Pompholyxophrys_punicea_v1_NODE_46_length_4478_cov_10.250283.p2 type:complete len:407 gc:universal NODE_46_length_4478_cov_10.250283:459-1679(+)